MQIEQLIFFFYFLVAASILFGLFAIFTLSSKDDSSLLTLEEFDVKSDQGASPSKDLLPFAALYDLHKRIHNLKIREQLLIIAITYLIIVTAAFVGVTLYQLEGEVQQEREDAKPVNIEGAVREANLKHEEFQKWYECISDIQHFQDQQQDGETARAQIRSSDSRCRIYTGKIIFIAYPLKTEIQNGELLSDILKLQTDEEKGRGYKLITFDTADNYNAALNDYRSTLESLQKDVQKTEENLSQPTSGVKKDDQTAFTPALISTLFARLAVVLMLMYFVQTLLNIYRYTTTLKSFYASRIDALLLAPMTDIPEEKFFELMTPGSVEFGKPPKGLNDQVSELTKQLIAKLPTAK